MRIKTVNLLALPILLAFITSCTFTTIKPNAAVFNNTDSLDQALVRLVNASVNLAGKETKTNGKTKSELEITVTNGQNVPEEFSGKMRFARQIAAEVKSHLKDAKQFDVYKVAFVTKEGSQTVSTTNGLSYMFGSDALEAP